MKFRVINTMVLLLMTSSVYASNATEGYVDNAFQNSYKILSDTYFDETSIKREVNNKTANFIINDDLSDYVDKTELDNKQQSIETAFVKSADVDTLMNGYLSDYAFKDDLNSYKTKESATVALNNEVSNYANSTNADSYEKASDFESVKNKVQSFTNLLTISLPMNNILFGTSVVYSKSGVLLSDADRDVTQKESGATLLTITDADDGVAGKYICLATINGFSLPNSQANLSQDSERFNYAISPVGFSSGDYISNNGSFIVNKTDDKDLFYSMSRAVSIFTVQKNQEVSIEIANKTGKSAGDSKYVGNMTCQQLTII